MNFGLALPNSGPLASPVNIRRVAEEAESLGYDALLVHDHISYDTEWLGHRTSGLTRPHADIAPDLYESLVTLSFAAAATTSVRLMTSVLVLPLRDPRVLARQLITLQALSGHRLSLGIGSGDYPADFRVMEIPYAEKAAYTREYVEALGALLPGGRSDFQGDRIRIDRGAFFPETAHIPLLMGGGIRPNPRSGCPGALRAPAPGPRQVVPRLGPRRAARGHCARHRHPLAPCGRRGSSIDAIRDSRAVAALHR